MICELLRLIITTRPERLPGKPKDTSKRTPDRLLPSKAKLPKHSANQPRHRNGSAEWKSRERELPEHKGHSAH